MFGLMDGVKRYLGCVGLVFIAASLSFSVFGEQEGICVDCVKGDQTRQEIQNMNKLTCEAQQSLPECKNVPNILRPDCDNPSKFIASMVCPVMVAGGLFGALSSTIVLLGKATPVLASGSVTLAGGTLARTAMSTSLYIPWITAVVAGGGAAYFAYVYHRKVQEVKKNAHLRGLNPTDKESIKKVARQEIQHSIGKRVYDVVYGDRHCYNEAVQNARMCGLMAGVTGTAIMSGGVSMGIVGAAGGSAAVATLGVVSGSATGLTGGLSLHILAKEHKEVRDDVLKRLQSESSVPSATENVDQLLQEVSQ